MLVDDLRAFARAHPDAAIICNDAADILAGQYERSAQQTALLESQAKALSEAEAEAERDRARMKLLAATFDGNTFEARALSAEARLAEAREVIQRLEWSCEQLAATRPHSVYAAMIAAGQAQALLELDNARRAARAFTNAAKGKTDARSE